MNIEKVVYTSNMNFINMTLKIEKMKKDGNNGMKDIVIRNANPSDARAITDLVNYMWRKTYSHILPVEIFEKREFNKEDKIQKLKETLSEDNSFHFVVEKNGVITGFAGASQKNNEEMGDNIPQLYAMYFKEDIQGLGISLEVAKVIVKKLLDMGYTQMVTGCLVGNKFNGAHVALGGKKVKEKPMERLNGALENIYLYEDISKILTMTMKDAFENVKNAKKEGLL